MQISSTNPRLASQQVLALRAMLAKRGEQSSRTAQIAAGLAAARGGAKRLVGADKLRTWLGGELDRIVSQRQARRVARFVPGPVPLREKMERSVRQAVLAAYPLCGYRVAVSQWAGGDHEVIVGLNQYTTASGCAKKVWSDNGKWSGSNSEHHLVVTPRWRLDVERRGLAVVDSMLTLDAWPFETPKSGDLFPTSEPEGQGPYKACWVRQGRGVGLEVERGLICRGCDGAWHHASSLAGAKQQDRNLLKALEVAKATATLQSTVCLHYQEVRP